MLLQLYLTNLAQAHSQASQGVATPLPHTHHTHSLSLSHTHTHTHMHITHSQESTGKHWVSFHFQQSRDELVWVTVVGQASIFLALCLHSAVGELLRQRSNKAIRKPSENVRGRVYSWDHQKELEGVVGIREREGVVGIRDKEGRDNITHWQ